MSARRQGRKWSAAVTHGSNALDLKHGVFKLADPHRIALSLKNSAARSHRRKGTPFQSAMSMLNFYINRAGSGLTGRQKNILTRAKQELRQVFNRRNFQSVLNARPPRSVKKYQHRKLKTHHFCTK